MKGGRAGELPKDILKLERERKLFGESENFIRIIPVR